MMDTTFYVVVSNTDGGEFEIASREMSDDAVYSHIQQVYNAMTELEALLPFGKVTSQWSDRSKQSITVTYSWGDKETVRIYKIAPVGER